MESADSLNNPLIKVGRSGIGQLYFINMNILHLLIPFYLVFTGCNLFNTGNDQEKFEPTFRAEINGEIFDITQVKVPLGRYNAVLSTQGAYSYLAVFGDFFSENLFPYKEQISFLLAYDANKSKYSSALDSIQVDEFSYRRIGGLYYESDGDAPVSRYSSDVNDNGYIFVEIELLDNGEKVIYGTFEFIAIVDSRVDKYSQRVDQDTLHITNGEYRLLLDDRREE